MNVYQLRADSNVYDSLLLVDDDWDAFPEFDGRELARGWTPVSVEISREKMRGPKPKPGDFPSLAARAPVFNAKAVEALKDILLPHGEILPLASRDGVFFAFNVTRVIDALDESASELELFSDGGIMKIQRYVFRQERLTVPVFKLRQTPDMAPLVTDAFVTRVEQAGLLGFLFRHVWPAAA